VSAIFLEKISEGKIGTANPQFFDSFRGVNLGTIIEHKSIAVATTICCGVRIPGIRETVIDCVTKSSFLKYRQI